ncbi:3-oxoacyl-ACP reductase FabG [Marinagarivorans cellulosilyticus]|uniref:3-oxoacyl-[acyl-carrier-protein] reductase n=1 Tax=Marinagarivorans cellulosilyticus TaxID=2721545 RepID=A0AAN2BJA4_9GAMM|nr:3-oxoacyl-ACP reductase FabG [Marinagarivorans cellulosilyticus]BCD96752.1 3-oxoacyl-[acyl-carrier protein] reductase [Marinagarivorans cellulosilyticus]
MSDAKRVALVTGASRGIGAAIAQKLGADGFIVIGTATSANGASAISEKLAASGIEGEGMVLNVADSESVNAVVADIAKKYSAVTVLVNNAGITKDNLLMRMSDEEWFDVIDTNLNSIFRLTKACLRGMLKAKWGRVVSITSIVGCMGNAGQTNYAATKAGVAGFARSMAQEVGSRNITVNAVAPGFIDTDMTKALPEEQRKKLESSIALNRLGQPEEIAGVVAFLCSDAAAYVTGETVQVNGGMYMQ